MISSISLENFRLHSKLNINFNKNKVLIYGSNAVGKTSILEAIYYVLTTKSFRTSDKSKLIQNEKKFLKVEVSILDEKIKAIETDDTSKFFINNKIVRKASDYIGKYPVIIFSNSDFNLFILTPQYRREYFDFLIMQIDNSYAKDLSNYQKILKERNALLKNIDKNANLTFLNIITEQLKKECKKIVLKRQRYIDLLNSILAENNFNLDDNIINIVYNPNVKIDEIEFIFEKNKLKEIDQGITLYGVQKDDFKILFNNKNIKDVASNGEMQLSLLKIKYSIIKVLKNLSKETVFLIDDITNMLDSNNQNKVLKSLPNDFQIIISSVKDIIELKEIQKINIK